ncbi:hypothetical protein L6164_011182 [Bauhinia variegata]|uniref:Uncharacterized protein n=1 Tax=Bauhinia variegata TaxID=167791 RepID=A0ACB9P533_BAUVA|nr:hypothetical protein L6164_011182 [Bauhinia variegata]
MALTLFRLSVILLCLSSHICSRAVPVTRTQSLMQSDPQVRVSLENTNLQVSTVRRWEQPSFSERMDLELLDYIPPGSNNRHTPRAP